MSQTQDLAELARSLIRKAREGTLQGAELDRAAGRIDKLAGPGYHLMSLRPTECHRLLHTQLEPLQLTARAHGYTLAVHGSVARDVDLIAVPWVDEAASPRALIAALMATLGRCDLCNGEQPVTRPHGRLAWSIWSHAFTTYLDISVMPPKAESKEV